jgi:uncharacterized membrane protein
MLLATVGLILAVASPVHAQTPRTDVPGFSVRFLGAGVPAAINALNQVVGWRDVSGARRAVLFDGPARDLPMLAGMASCEATDINDLGVVVGSCAPSVYQTGRAVVWTPAGGTYSVAEIPTFPGDLGSSAAAINNLGDIVGTHSYTMLNGLQVGAGFVWRESTGAIDLLQAYGMNDFPADINDAGQVVAGQKRLDLATGVVTDLGVPAGPPAYFAARTAAISPNGTIAGTGYPASSSNPQRVIRYRAGAWQVLGGWGQYDGGSGVNDAGTVVGRGVAYLGGNAIKAVAWFDQMRTLLYVDDFLVESARDWIVLSTADLNADTTGGGGVPGVGRIVGVAQNLVTGEYGVVRVEPAGALPVPNAPSNLQATPREATWQQPYNAVALAWTDNSRTDWGFRVERSPASQGAWTELGRTINTTFEDTTGDLGVTYDYRVRAIGLAGDSAAANARATFPSKPVDRTPPTVAFVAPLDGAGVSGTVQVVVDATDNEGLNFIDVQYQPNMGQSQICTASPGGALSYRMSCSWNTRDLAPGAYLLTAYASDLLGNYATQTITVQVGSSPSPSVRVSSVTLSSSTRRGVTTVTGRVTVVDETGTPMRSAGVWASWATPGGTSTAFAYTDRRGVATVTASAGLGTYTLTVTDVILTGYRFDASGSQLSASLTVP